jgi:hypothetical protein
MSNDELNGSVDTSAGSGDFSLEIDPELLDGLDDDVNPESTNQPHENEADGANSAQNKSEEQKPGKEEVELTADDLGNMSWAEISQNKHRIPKPLMGMFKDAERVIQGKMQSVAEEKKEVKRLQEKLERLERQIQEEPPYIKAERERQERERNQERLENMTPEERREHELEQTNKSLREKLEAVERAFETERFMAMKREMISDIKDEMLSENLPVKDSKVVYDIWTQNALKNQEFTIADAVQAYKAERSKPKEMSEKDIEALVAQKLKEKIAELKAKQKGATGVRGSSSSAGRNLPSNQHKEAKKFESPEDIFGDLEHYMPDD